MTSYEKGLVELFGLMDQETDTNNPALNDVTKIESVRDKAGLNIYDADTVYKDGDGYRFSKIDAPEMPSVSTKLDRLKKAKESKYGRHVSIANPGEVAAMEAYLYTVNKETSPTKGLGDSAISFNDTEEAPTVIDYGSEYLKAKDSDKGKFNRTIIDNQEFQNKMLEEGYATPYFNPSESDKDRVRMAKEQKKGLWGSEEGSKELSSVLKKRKINLDDDIREKSYYEQLKDLPQAMMAGFGKSTYDMADTTVELVGDVAGRGIGVFDEKTGKWIDKKVDLATDKQKTETVNDIVGYDNSFTQENMAKAEMLWDEAWSKWDLLSPSTWTNVDVSKIGSAAKVAFNDLETAGYSLGYMAPALVGLVGKGATKLVGGAVKNHADLAKETAKRVAKGEITKEAAEGLLKESVKAMSKKDKVKLFLTNNADALAYGAMMNNNQLDEYIENNGGEEATVLRSILGTAANAVGMKLDVGIMNSIIKPGNKDIGTKVNQLVRKLGQDKATKFVGTLASMTARAGAAGLKELPQEYTQTFIEEFNKIYGTEKGETVLEATREAGSNAGVGALAGLAGGVHTSIGTQAVTGALNTVRGQASRFIDTEEDIVVPEDRVEEPIVDTRSKSTEDLNVELNDFISKASTGEVTRDEYLYAKEVKAELAKRKTAEVLTENIQGKTLGSISDIEKYLVENGIADKIESQPVEDIIEDVIVSHIASENLSDIGVALKNLEGVKDQDKWNKAIDEAIEVRISMDNLTEGAKSSRFGVAIEGISSKENRRGYVEYAEKALKGDTKALRYMADFASVQETKAEALNNLKNDTIASVNAQIDEIMTKVEGKATREEVVRAMAYFNSALVTEDGRNNLKATFAKVASILNADGIKKESELNITKFLTAKYANEYYSKSEGLFNQNRFEVLPDIARDLGIKGIEWKKEREKSSAGKVIEYIEQEIADMDRLSAYVSKKLNGDTLVDESIEAFDSAEVADKIVRGEETTDADKQVQDNQSADLEVELQKRVEEEESNSAIESIEKFENINIYDYTLDDALRLMEEVTNLATTFSKDSDERKRLRKVYADITSTLSEMERSGKALEDEKKGNSSVLSKSIVDKANEENKQKPIKSTKGSNDTINRILDIDLDKASPNELRDLVNMQIGLGKETDEVKEEITQKQTRAKELLQTKIDELVNGKDITIQIAIEQLELMKEVKASNIAELKELETNNETVAKDAKELQGLKKTISEVISEKKELQVLKAKYKQIRAKEDEALKKAHDRYEEEVKRSKKLLGKVVMGPVDKLPANIQKVLNKILKTLTQAQQEVVQALKTAITNARRVMTRVKKADTQSKIDEIENRLSKIADELDGLYFQKKLVDTKETREYIEKKKEIQRDVKSANKEIEILEDRIKGTEYFKAVILKSLRGNNKEARVNTPKGASKEELAKIPKYPLDLAKIVAVNTKSISTLATAPVTEVIKSVEGMKKALITNGMIPENINDTTLARYPYLMLLLDEDKNINTNVAAAMTAAVSRYIDEKKISLTQLTTRDMESFYGIGESDINGQSEVRHLGIPVKYVASDLAKSIASILGIKPAKGVEQEVYEKLVLGLAQAALYTQVGPKGMLHEVIADLDRDASSITIKMNEDVTDARLSTVKNVSRELANKFKIEETKKTFRTEPRDITIDDVEIKRNEITKPSKEQAEAIVKYTNLAWKPIEGIMNKLSELSDDTLRNLLGYKEESKYQSRETREGIKGKNLQINADIDALREFDKAYRNGDLKDGAYFDWTIWKVGRNAIESADFNPQNKKLHRYIGVYEAQKGEVTNGDISETIFKLGVAQALKFDIDKEPVEESKKHADKILTEKGLDRLEKAINAGKTEFVIGKESFEFEELSHAVMALVEGKKYLEAKGKPFESSMILESDGLTNGFAFKMLQYLVTKEDGFELDKHLITWLDKAGVSIGKDKVEAVVDRIKNGEIVDAYRTLGMEIPAKDDKGEYVSIEKTALDGIEDTVGKAISNHRETDRAKLAGYMKQKNVLESHGVLTEVEEFTYEVDKAAKKRIIGNVKLFLGTQKELTEEREVADAEGNNTIESVITSAARALMKQPFMTFGYGAGFQSILNAVTSIVETELVDTLVSTDTNTKEYEKAWEFAKAIGMNESHIEMMRKELIPKVEVNDSNLHQLIQDYVAITYGKRIEEVLSEEFKTLTEVNKEIIQASTTLFNIWRVVYDKLAGVKDGEQVSREEKERLIKETMSIFPVVASPLGKDLLVDGIPLVTSKTASGTANKYGNAQVSLDKSRFGKSSATVSAVRSDYDAIGVGSVVNMNQMIDGGTMTRVMNKYDIGQVFDALLLGVGQADAVSFVNEVFGKFATESEWSHIGAVSDRLSDILYGRELERLLKKVGMTKEQLLEEVDSRNRKDEDSGKDSKIPTAVKIAENIAARNLQNKMLRNELISNDIVFEQYVLDGEHVYTHKTKDNSKYTNDTIRKIVKELAGKYKIKELNNVLNQIVDLTKEC